MRPARKFCGTFVDRQPSGLACICVVLLDTYRPKALVELRAILADNPVPFRAKAAS
ncbi:hypothetical protein [uncultured Jannaschia sp.]|uniref:hypothetical protein n=1 Tax=uncultured Jannaschia sp. TaxID=293347 RepID=UPI00260B6325|nr:hypothetical protein [uncultured Jannaschia sp.]